MCVLVIVWVVLCYVFCRGVMILWYVWVCFGLWLMFVLMSVWDRKIYSECRLVLLF